MTTQVSPIKAVVFDIGNVLIEWNPERYFDQAIGPGRRREMFAAVPLHVLNDDVDRGQNFSQVWDQAAKQYPDWANEICMWRDNWIKLASPEIPHSVRLMRALREADVAVFALSNFGIETFEVAKTYYDFLTEFDQAYISGYLKMIKPDPDIYQVLETVSGLAPSCLLFADDRVDNIAAAQARGWHTHLFTEPQAWADTLVGHGLLSVDAAK